MKQALRKRAGLNAGRRKLGCAVLAGVLVFGSVVQWPASPVHAEEGGEWPQFQQDEARSGRTMAMTPVTTPSLSWYRYTWNSGTLGIETPVITAGGMAYVHAGNGLWAFDAVTGETVWHQTIPGSSTLQTSTPAYGDGKVFIATFGGWLRAYDALTGENLWNNNISEVILQCPITYYDGHLYIGQGGAATGDNSYFCLDTAGNIVWEYTTETVGYLWSGASITGDIIVFASHDAVLTSLNRHTGQLLDMLDLYGLEADAGKARASVSYCDGYVYTTSEAGLNAGYIWKIGIDVTSGVFDPQAGWHNAIGFSTSTPVVYGDRVYVGEGEHGCDGSLICLDDGDGSIIWQYAVPGGVKSSPALSVQEQNIYLYFHTSMEDGALYCLNGDGGLVWQWNPPDDDAYILQGVSLAGEQIYLGTCSGYLYCLDDGIRSWDINKDGMTDVFDMAEVGCCFGENGNTGWLRQDINKDGSIDVLDIGIIGIHWGK